MKNVRYDSVYKSMMDLKDVGVDIEKLPIRIFLSEEEYIEIVRCESGWVMYDSRTYIDEEGYPHDKKYKVKKAFNTCIVYKKQIGKENQSR